jgi:hypothetical protein
MTGLADALVMLGLPGGIKDAIAAKGIRNSHLLALPQPAHQPVGRNVSSRLDPLFWPRRLSWAGLSQFGFAALRRSRPRLGPGGMLASSRPSGCAKR